MQRPMNSEGQNDFHYALPSHRSWQPPPPPENDAWQENTTPMQAMQWPQPLLQVMKAWQRPGQRQLSVQGTDDGGPDSYGDGADEVRAGEVELADSGITANRSNDGENEDDQRKGSNHNFTSKLSLPFSIPVPLLKKHKPQQQQQQQQISSANLSKNKAEKPKNVLLSGSTMDETIDDSYHLQKEPEMKEFSNSGGRSRRKLVFPSVFFKRGKRNNSFSGRNNNDRTANEGQYNMQQADQNVDNDFYSNTNHNDNHNNNNHHEQKHILKELFHWYINRSRTKKLITAMVGITSILVIADAFVLKTGYVHGFLDGFLEWMREHGGLGVWAYIVMLVITSLIFIPPSILIFASGFIFRSIYGPFNGPLIALLSSYIGAILGGTIGFLRANYMTRDLIQILMRRYPIFRAVDRAMIRNSLRVMILMRLNCLIPFGVLNYVFGITGINVASFVLAMVGVVPWHLWLIYLGASANSVYDEGTETSLMAVVLMGMGAAFGVIGMVITWRFARKELQKEVDSSPSAHTIDHYRITDENLKPHQSFHGSHAIEDADLCFTDYVRMQFMGQDREVEMENATGLEQDYRSKFDWTEIILDDFS